MHTGRKKADRPIDIYDVILPEPPARRYRANPVPAVLIEDAVFEVVGPARTRHAAGDLRARPATAPRSGPAAFAASAGAGSVVGLERLLGRLSPQTFVTLIASLFFLVFWSCGGFAAFATQPPVLASSPSAIENVFTEIVDANGMKVLAVGGTFTNLSGAGMTMPEISVAAEGGEIIGTIAPARPRVMAGESVRFYGRFKLEHGKSGRIDVFPAPR